MAEEKHGRLTKLVVGWPIISSILAGLWTEGSGSVEEVGGTSLSLHCQPKTT
jgi:hypothetical protein